MNRIALLSLALVVQAALPATAEQKSTDLVTPRAGVVCQSGTTLCRTREEVSALGRFRLGRSLLCDSHLGLCWQQQGSIKTVNWRVSGELYGSTSPGTGWGDWRPQQATLPLHWQAQCLWHQQPSQGTESENNPQTTQLYAGPCSFNESLKAGGSGQQPSRTLEIRLGATTLLSFLWQGGRYRFASSTSSLKSGPLNQQTGKGQSKDIELASTPSADGDATGAASPLSLQDQGSRAMLRWASFQLLTARTPDDLSLPASDEALTIESLELSTQPQPRQP